MVSIDHVKMNSWCKFGECSTNRYHNVDLIISSQPWSLKREMWVMDTNDNVTSADHVKMNNWFQIGECITRRYLKMDLTISS